MPIKKTTLSEIHRDLNTGFQLVGEKLDAIAGKFDTAISHLEATATTYKSIQEELTAHRAGLDRVERRLAAIEAKLDMEPLH